MKGNNMKGNNMNRRDLFVKLLLVPFVKKPTLTYPSGISGQILWMRRDGTLMWKNKNCINIQRRQK